MPVPLVLVSDVIQTNPQYESDTQGDVAPRKDYVEIARQLQADLIGYNPAGQGWYRWARRLQRTFKLDLVESLSAVRRAAGYSVILSTSEKVAIPMAALLNVTRQNVPHVVIGHKLSSILKNRLFRTWQLHHTFSQVVCVSRSQVDYTINRLGVSPEKVAFVHDKVDHHFFHPLPQVDDGFILTVGKEQRDYRLLLRALSGTGIKLVVVASSPWSTSQAKMNQADDDVTVLSHIPYHQLRTLYAQARLVVVPLFGVDYAAGVNTVLEAMAMAKPLVVSRTKDITDYVTHGETGLCVSPGDVAELKERILSVWERPSALNRLGANARQAVEEKMNLDIYVNQVARIVQKTVSNHQSGGA